MPPEPPLLRLLDALRVLGLAGLGIALPPAVCLGALWLVLSLAGIHDPDAIGTLRHLLADDLHLAVRDADLSTERGLDREWFDGHRDWASQEGVEPLADFGIRRGGYRSFVRAGSAGPDEPVVFGLQTLYPGAPPPSVHFLSRCGEGRWIETSDEIEPPEDRAHPPWLDLHLDRHADRGTLRALHTQRLDRLCEDPRPVDREALRAFFQADRGWWFETCAGDLVGMTRPCRVDAPKGTP